MTPKQVKKLYEKHGSLKAIYRNTEHSWRQIRKAYTEARESGVMDPVRPGRKPRISRGKVHETKPKVYSRPKKGDRHRFLFTSAQNNTLVWKPFWDNLMAYAEYLDAEIHVARFTYNKRSLGAKGDKSNLTTEKFAEAEDYWWDEKLSGYLSDERTKVAEGLVWLGEMNILPTAVNPVSGLQTYTGTDSSIIPHVKIALESVPAGDEAKMVYTTGAVTKRNYVQKKAGLKGELHHTYGALLVETDDQGRWFARQINADSQGNFYDLDRRVAEGEISEGNPALAVVWGDIHHAQLDPVTKESAWGKGGILDTLKPSYQVMHDVMDFHGPSHHAVKDPHEMFRRYLSGHLDVQKEVEGLCDFFHYVHREGCETVVVHSNHDEHLTRWLKEQEGLKDPINAPFWLEMNRECLRCIETGRDVEGLELAVEKSDPSAPARFLRQDESFRVADIELGIHGHAGPNGSRGTPRNLAKIGDKAITGHTHTAGIVEGVYTVGMSGVLNPNYVRGPSSWSATHCVIYPNGKRALITVKNGQWAAGRGLSSKTRNKIRKRQQK